MPTFNDGDGSMGDASGTRLRPSVAVYLRQERSAAYAARRYLRRTAVRSELARGHRVAGPVGLAESFELAVLVQRAGVGQ